MARKGPLVGYNHNLRYAGRLFHVQTEDSGAKNPHIFTHLFYEGTILASRRTEYASVDAEDVVRKLMQEQHKLLIKELKRGIHDQHIADFFGARSEAVVPDEPEEYIAGPSPGAELSQALDLDAMGAPSGFVTGRIAVAGLGAPVAPRPTEFVRKGGQKERISLARPTAQPEITPPPLAPPVLRLQPRNPTAGVAARPAQRGGFLAFISGLFGRKPAEAAGPAPAPARPAAPVPGAAGAQAVPSPLIEASEEEIDQLIDSFVTG